MSDHKLVTVRWNEPYDAAADSLGSWEHGIAFKRLSHLIAKGLAGYMKRPPEMAGMMPSEWAALCLARECPDVLDAVRGGK